MPYIWLGLTLYSGISDEMELFFLIQMISVFLYSVFHMVESLLRKATEYENDLKALIEVQAVYFKP